MRRSSVFATALTLPLAAAAQGVSIALDWTLDTNLVGLIMAEARGFYEEAGLEVEILPYSDTSSSALLASGAADFAYMTSLGFMSARVTGAEIVALWVTMQHETGRLVYRSDNAEIPASPTSRAGSTPASAARGRTR